MPTYISLLNYTQQGIANIKDSPDRLDTARQQGRGMNVDIHAFYLVMGQYDAVVIADAPDDATFARFILASGALGNVSTQTMRAFTEDEFRNIVNTLP